MTIKEITTILDQLAPPSLQESYDNAGLLTGNPMWVCGGVLVCLDATEAVIQEAIDKKANLVVAHHPIIFKGLKKITGKNYVEQTIIKAIKNDIAIYAIHTNLDNVMHGVNGKIADMLGLKNLQVLEPKENLLLKLAVFVPAGHKEQLMQALFSAGAGHIGHYSECSFSVPGTGSFMAGENTKPFVGREGQLHLEQEDRLEVIFPVWLKDKVLAAMKKAHPYEEVAYDVYRLDNQFLQTGSGMTGELETPVDEIAFLKMLKNTFKLSVIRHTSITGRPVKKVAFCGGAGSFLLGAAKASGADVYISSDFKYHEFFDADGRLMIADIGHFESEQYTIDLLYDKIREKFPNFAVLKTGVYTNPVLYFS